MHPNAQLIERLYSAFAKRDYATMNACYAADATFEDAVFNLKGEQIGQMWHMLCANAKEFSLEFRDVSASDTSGSAHWEARYVFSSTGRPVHNVIDAEFQIRDGKIVAHRDRFDFWRWSRQALGVAGLLLGWTPILQNKVRAQAAKNLAAFSIMQGKK
ncbi:MAG: nuclear transport factor 2 family protein [Pseudoxanthomonas sp.]